jgi:hypothetical protein
LHPLYRRTDFLLSLSATCIIPSYIASIFI